MPKSTRPPRLLFTTVSLNIELEFQARGKAKERYMEVFLFNLVAEEIILDNLSEGETNIET